MKTHLIKTGLLLAGVCCSAPTLADVQFNGFASIKAGVLFDDPTDLNENGTIEEEEMILDGFYDKDLSFKPESVFALQVYSDLGDGLSVTAQLFAEGRNDFDVKARWAYLSYELSDEWKINVGRMVLPMFYKSESEKIGYTVNSNRLPRAVYDDFDFGVVEGVRLNNSTELGDWTVNSSFGFYSWNGDFQTSTNGNYETSFDNILSASVEFNYDWLTLFAGGFITEIDFSNLDNNVVFPGIDGGAQFYGLSATETQSLKDTVQLSGDGEYYYLGFSVDYNDWLMTAEYADYGIKDSGDSFNEAYYVMAGKRINEFTLLYTYEKLDEPADYSALSGFSAPAQGIGRAIVDSLLTNQFTTQTLSLRYDFHSNAAFKIDVFNSKPNGSSEDQTGMSFGVDLVF